MGHLNELTTLDLRLQDDELTCVSARVEQTLPRELVLRVGAGLVRGQRAVSCLAAPQAGDRVSVMRDARGRHYVTAILEREGDGELLLSSDRALAIESTDAGLRLNAATQVDILAGERIRVRAPLLETLVSRCTTFAKSLQLTAGEAIMNSGLARLCAELVDVAAQRIGVAAQHSHRQIDGTEQLRCRHLDLQASELAQLRAPTTLIKAKDLAKVDAAQIQIG